MLWDAVNDPTFLAASQVFFREHKANLLDDLVRAVRRPQRDTHLESYIAGKVEAAETCLQLLRDFAERSFREAKQ